MKKILVSMFAVAALAACTSEQTIVAPQNEAIGFETFVDNSTRATDITTNNIDNFGVYGTVAKDGNSALIFKNTEVTKSGDAFVYSPAQYWIAAAEYDFLAFAPRTNAKWTYAPEGQLAQNGEFSFVNDTDADQDVVYAYTAKTTEATLNASNTQAVAFTFKHVLSKVAFSFTNTFTDGNTTLNVYNVKINNTAKTGTMAIVDGEDKAWVGDGDLIVPFGAQAADATAALANGAELKLDHHYVIPAQRAYNITFSVDLYQAGVYLATYNHTIESTINFAKNGNYVLSVKLAPESIDPENELYPIEFTVDKVEDWDVESSVVLSATEVATADALKAAIAEGGEIRLTEDIALDENGLTIAKQANIDLNGNTLTVAASNFVNESTLTLSNGTVSGSDSQAGRRAIVNKGNLTMNNVTVAQVWTDGGSAINNDGTTAVAVLNNVTVNAQNMAVSNKNGAKMTINGGNFVGNGTGGSYAIVNQLGSTMTINGGTFVGGHGVVSSTEASTTTLNGGTYHCTCTYTGNSDWVLYTSYASGEEEPGTIKYNEANCTFTTVRTDGKIYYSACESYIDKL